MSRRDGAQLARATRTRAAPDSVAIASGRVNTMTDAPNQVLPEPLAELRIRTVEGS